MRAFTANGSNRHVRTTHKLDQISNAWAHKFKFSVSTGSTEKGVPFLGWGYTYETLREDA